LTGNEEQNIISKTTQDLLPRRRKDDALMETETITAIIGLWKPILAAACLVAIITQRKGIGQFLSGFKNFRYKKGDTEVAVEGGISEEALEEHRESVTEPSPEPEDPEPMNESAPPTQNELFSEMHTAFLEGKIEEAAEILARLQEAEEDPEQKKVYEAIYLYLRYKHANDASAIEKMEALSENETLRHKVLYWVAACHELSRNYQKAVGAYKRSLACQLEDDNIGKYTVAMAKALAKTGKMMEAFQELSASLGRVTSDAAKAELYQGIADICETQGNTRLRAVALQKVLHFRPEDVGALFSAAHIQGEADMKRLSAVNYETLLRFDPQHKAALNNLGVEYNNLGLLMRSTSSYRKAVEARETLAMANLSNIYMKGGFQEEAQELLDKAIQEESPHKNVGLSRASLADQKEEEEREWESLTTEAHVQQQFFWDFAEARFESTNVATSFAGDWLTSDGHPISITQEGQKIISKWEEDKSGEEIVGVVTGRAVDVQYKNKKPGLLLSSPYRWSDPEEGLGYMTIDQGFIQILLLKGKQPRFLALSRQD